jgi:hypothetical protein
MRGLMCANCSAAASDVLLNGKEIEFYCEAHFKDVLLDLAINNDPFELRGVADAEKPAAFAAMRVFRVGEP